MNEKQAQILKILNKLERNTISYSSKNNSSAVKHGDKANNKQIASQNTQNNTEQSNEKLISHNTKEINVVVGCDDEEKPCTPTHANNDRDQTLCGHPAE